MRPGGLYHFMAANPYAAGMGTQDWTGAGYLIRRPYIEGAPIIYEDEPWVFRDNPAAGQNIGGPREYRQTLARLLNGLAESKFVLIKTLEWAAHEQNLEAEPGDWEHFTAHLPPWLWFWTLYQPDLSFTVS